MFSTMWNIAKWLDLRLVNQKNEFKTKTVIFNFYFSILITNSKNNSWWLLDKYKKYKFSSATQ